MNTWIAKKKKIAGWARSARERRVNKWNMDRRCTADTFTHKSNQPYNRLVHNRNGERWNESNRLAFCPYKSRCSSLPSSASISFFSSFFFLIRSLNIRCNHLSKSVVAHKSNNQTFHCFPNERESTGIYGGSCFCVMLEIPPMANTQAAERNGGVEVTGKNIVGEWHSVGVRCCEGCEESGINDGPSAANSCNARRRWHLMYYDWIGCNGMHCSENQIWVSQSIGDTVTRIMRGIGASWSENGVSPAGEVIGFEWGIGRRTNGHSLCEWTNREKKIAIKSCMDSGQTRVTPKPNQRKWEENYLWMAHTKRQKCEERNLYHL